MTAALALFAQRVTAAMQPVALVLPNSALLGDAVAAMATRGADCAVVTDAAGAVAGIVTEQDIVRRVAFRREAAAPLSVAMTAPVATVAADDYLYRVIARMRAGGFRHLPVVDRAGRPVGMVDLRAVVTAAGGALLDRLRELADGPDLVGLSRAKQAQGAFAALLLADGVPVSEVLDIVNEINRDLHRRALASALAKMGAEPPCAFTPILMGSAGRGESLLRPDQDNGFLLDDDAPADADAWFAELARHFTDALAAIGFPYCDGGVMATNPQWRKTGRAWRDDAASWIGSRSPQALMNMDIFCDFAGLAGPLGPVGALRAAVGEAVARTPAFLALLSTATLDMPVGLNWLGRLRVERGGRMNLKLHGLMPLVAAVRLYALKAALPQTGTRQRLDALHGHGVFDRDQTAVLHAAFAALVRLVLRQQTADHARGQVPANHVAVAALAGHERAELADHLRAIDRLARRARADFAGRIL